MRPEIRAHLSKSKGDMDAWHEWLTDLPRDRHGH